MYGIYDKRTDVCVYVDAYKPKPSMCKMQKHLRLHGAQHFEPRHLDPEPGKPPFGAARIC